MLAGTPTTHDPPARGVVLSTMATLAAWRHAAPLRLRQSASQRQCITTPPPSSAAAVGSRVSRLLAVVRPARAAAAPAPPPPRRTSRHACRLTVPQWRHGAGAEGR